MSIVDNDDGNVRNWVPISLSNGKCNSASSSDLFFADATLLFGTTTPITSCNYTRMKQF